MVFHGAEVILVKLAASAINARKPGGDLNGRDNYWPALQEGTGAVSWGMILHGSLTFLYPWSAEVLTAFVPDLSFQGCLYSEQPWKIETGHLPLG